MTNQIDKDIIEKFTALGRELGAEAAAYWSTDPHGSAKNAEPLEGEYDALDDLCWELLGKSLDELDDCTHDDIWEPWLDAFRDGRDDWIKDNE